jgi:hypothetical protein
LSSDGEYAGKKRKRKGASKRKTRGLLSDRKGLKPFSRLLEEVQFWSYNVCRHAI